MKPRSASTFDMRFKTPGSTDRAAGSGPDDPIRLARCVKRGPFQVLVFLLAGLLALVAAASADAQGAAADDYKLGTQDKVRLKVFEWRPSRDEIFEWKALNDVFTVSAAGDLSLPLIGDVPAAGVGASELAKTIEEHLRTRLGLAESPAISAEIAEYRPFFIAGQVERPGAYPYQPSLTILQALSLAGGLRRPTELGLSKLISGMGDMQLLALDKSATLARRARLEAELKEAPAVEFPAALTDRQKDPSIAVVMEQERNIFAARREAVQTQIGALEELKKFLQNEIASLGAQVETENKQMSLLDQELQSVSSLASKGLTPQSRQLGLERSMAQMEGGRLRIQSNLLRARQEMSRADVSILELRYKRRNEAAVELRQTQATLEQIGQKTATAEMLLSESQGFAQLRGIEPTYSIVRKIGSQTIELSAVETTPVQPGDTVKVVVPLYPASQLPPSAASGNRAPPQASAGPAPSSADGAQPSPQRNVAEQTGLTRR